MDFSPTETDLEVQRAARAYAQRVIAPRAHELSEGEIFPEAEVRGLAELGLMGVNVPSDLGGAEAGVVAYSLAMQEVAAACGSTAVTMSVTNMVAEIITRFGTRDQAERHVPRLCSGEYVAGSFALSEPEAGSDPGGMRTTAKKTATGWVLDGQKQWITSGTHAGVFVVWARTGEPGTRGISCFLVEQGAKGLRIGKREDKLGLRASSTVPLAFEGCEVPDAALFGPQGGGFKIAMTALDGGRIGIASQACGIAAAALAAATDYARQRRAFDRPIGDFQAIQWMLADSRTELDAARALTLRAAWLKGRGQPFSREASMAKLFASEACNRACQKAVQVLGGYGYTREFPVERYLRDARVTTIYEGTSEIQRTVIARMLLA